MGQNLRLMQTPLLICKGSLLSGPMPRLAAHLFKQAHIRHGHAAVSGFAHVVNGQQADLHGGEGFHFNTRGAGGFGRDGAMNVGGLVTGGEGHAHMAERQGVAQGNEVSGALGGLYSRHACNAQHITLFGVAIANQGQGVGVHFNATFCCGAAFGVGFVTYVDHVGLALCIKVGQG